MRDNVDTKLVAGSSSSSSSGLFRRLIEACKHKDQQTIRSILAAKPHLANQKDRNGRSLLHYAAILVRQGVENGSIECFELVADKCDSKLWWHQDLDGLSVLHLAVISSNLALVEHLILHLNSSNDGHEPKLRLIHAADNELHTPLHWAVITGSLASVRLLVTSGGVNMCHEPDLNGATPLHYATQSAGSETMRGHQTSQLRRLLAGRSSLDSTSREDSDGGSEVSHPMPTPGGDTAILEFMCQLEGIQLECRDKDERTPLLWAASSGTRPALLVLLGHGARATARDCNGLGALHCAASHGHCDCLESLLQADGAEPNQADKLNCTALFYAVLGANVDCLEMLLENGAEADWQDSKGRTAAHFAALKGQLQALKVLRERGGANLWLANRLGDLPLHYAIKSGRRQVVRWLLEQSPYEQAVNAINNLGRAPIHLAVQRNDMGLVVYLVQCGANLNQLARVRSGKSQSQYETALDLAGRLKCSPELVAVLEKNGAQSSAQVLANRQRGNLTLFQTMEADSPIGFETSCSSASPAANLNSKQPDRSSGSSVLSHSSVASLRGQAKQQPDLEHICASIKCELYPHHQRPAGEELEPIAVANVNLYASPCANCLRLGRSANRCATCRSKLADEDDEEEDDEGRDEDTDNEEMLYEEHRLPPLNTGGPHVVHHQDVVASMRRQRQRRAHDDEHRLPVILSESTSPSVDDTNQSARGGRRSAARSPAEEEPRFDRFSRDDTGRRSQSVGRTLRGRNSRQAKSPVGEYIRGGSRQSPIKRPTPGKVAAKMDTTRSPRHNKQPTRTSVVIKTRRLSVDSVELASRVEKAIWKYRQETKLFEELQLLKRSQIRSGRANEAVLVKRLVEHLRRDTQHLMGLDSYQGPYTYQAYERFLYDQLRKLSLSNRAKLSPLRGEAPATADDLRAQDDEAELELRRIVGDLEDLEEPRYYLEPTGASEEIRATVKADDNSKAAEVEHVHHLESSNEDQCLCGDDKGDRHETKASEPHSPEEEVAGSLSEAIMVDVLGNLTGSRAPSPSREAEEEPRDATVAADEGHESTSSGPMSPNGSSPTQRRRSVINIGNKMDVVYHDVGIEIEPAPEKSSDEEEIEDLGPMSNPELGDVKEEEEQQQQLVEKQDEPLKSMLTRRESSPPVYRRSAPIKRQRATSVESSTTPKEPQKVFNGHDLDEAKKRRRQSETVEKSPSESETRPKLASFRRHLARSQMSRIKYVPPQVSVELIRRRWAPIRARGRRELDESSEVLWLDNQKENNNNNLAKSQPNLNNHPSETPAGSAQANYILLYEINKGSQRAELEGEEAADAGGDGGGEQRRQQVEWCHKRLVRIVDVRSIKRTLSLPESLLYSNDLLKRFNILKL